MARARSTSTLWIHIIAWMIFISYEVTIAKVWDSKSGYEEFALYYVLDISLFYLNAEIISRYTASKEKIILILIPLMLLELLSYSSLSLAAGILFFKIKNNWAFYEVTTKDCAQAIWRVIYIIGFSTGYGFFRRAIRSAKETSQIKILQLQAEHGKTAMEKELFKSENAYLQSQINRHLLFNTLTFIYNSVFREAPKAGQSVMLLSETMHYALRQKDELVALSEEIEQIERYILLNELRFTNRLGLTFKAEIDNECGVASIPPLLLLTFVENIFKHGDLTSHNEDAVIHIACSKDILSMHTENFKKGWDLPQTQRHIGIDNARTRLESYYGTGNFSLNISDTEQKFIVDLMIRL